MKGHGRERLWGAGGGNNLSIGRLKDSKLERTKFAIFLYTREAIYDTHIHQFKSEMTRKQIIKTKIVFFFSINFNGGLVLYPSYKYCDEISGIWGEEEKGGTYDQ